MTRHRRGFTLLEVLIAIALMLALFGAMFGFLYDMLAARQRVLELTAQQRAAALLIDRIDADLQTCIVNHDQHGSGVKGDDVSLRVLSRGSLGHVEPASASDHAAFSDLQDTTYTFDASSHDVQVQRSAAGSEAGPSHSLGGRLFRVRLRYHDGQQWIGSFDSAETGHLPLAVEIAVWFDPWPGEDWADEQSDAMASELDSLTIDLEGTFDEQAYATRADRGMYDDPIPDRVRVVYIPDAQPDEAAEQPFMDAEEPTVEEPAAEQSQTEQPAASAEELP